MYEQTAKVLGVIERAPGRALKKETKLEIAKENRKAFQLDKLRRKLSADPSTISVHLSEAKLCLTCDHIYSGPYCPVCLGEAHDVIKDRYRDKAGNYLVNVPVIE